MIRTLISPEFTGERRERTRHEARPADCRSEGERTGELLRLHAALEREREQSQLLRHALELAASYFHAPLDRPEDDAAWATIVQAIRSRSGCLSLGD